MPFRWLTKGRVGLGEILVECLLLPKGGLGSLQEGSSGMNKTVARTFLGSGHALCFGGMDFRSWHGIVGMLWKRSGSHRTPGVGHWIGGQLL